MEQYEIFDLAVKLSQNPAGLKVRYKRSSIFNGGCIEDEKPELTVYTKYGTTLTAEQVREVMFYISEIYPEGSFDKSPGAISRDWTYIIFKHKNDDLELYVTVDMDVDEISKIVDCNLKMQKSNRLSYSLSCDTK